MNPQRWVTGTSGHLELLDEITGEVVARERRATSPRKGQLGSRHPGRPTKHALALAMGDFRGAFVVCPRLYFYNEETAHRILDAVAGGAYLTKLGRGNGIPPYAAICRWRGEEPEFDQKVRVALECRAITFEEAALELVAERPKPEDVPSLRLRFDIYRRAAARSNPERYENCGRKGRAKLIHRVNRIATFRLFL